MTRSCILLLAFAATGCSQFFGFQEAVVTPPEDALVDTVEDAALPDVPADVNTNAFTKRKPLTIVGAKVTGTVTNFPVLVRFTSDADLAAFARADGADLLFTAADGLTKLAHQIERFDALTGELVAWVQLPQLTSNTDTSIFLYFGNPTSPDQQSATAVWDADYLGVWHLAETTGTTVADSTVAARTGTKFTSDKPKPASAAIGGGQLFTDDKGGISIGNDPALDVQTVTIEMWVRLDTCNDGTVRRLIDFALAFDFSYALGYPCGDVTAVNDNSLLLDANNDHLHTSAGTLPFNQAHHVVFTSNPPKLYIDGNVRNAATTPITLAQDNLNTIIGNRESTQDRGMQGTLDEVRLSKVARSAAYVATSFTNQQSPATFVTVGAVEDTQ